MRRFLMVCALLWFASINSISQEVKPNGVFLVDSAKIGEQIPYSLSIRYPKQMEFLFPDSNYNFFPFEFISKDFFITRTDSLRSVDSAIFYLSTFEIEPIQKLFLPVFMISQGDSIVLYPPVDSIHLKALINQLPDSLNIKANSEYSEVFFDFNYPYLLIGVGGFMLLVVVGFLIFGKSIKRQYLLFRLKRNHRRFTQKFYLLIADLKSREGSLNAEKMLVTWKKYMEKLENIPYTKLTTKEIVSYPDNNSINDPLKDVDKSIYGSIKIEKLYESFENLEYFTEERYNTRLNQLKYG
ncbi:MAG: hypothetical protein O7F74_05015 [Bacteroidetes bacterium]|nr:hypothetical protein [Bacteroidota bacterium]